MQVKNFDFLIELSEQDTERVTGGFFSGCGHGKAAAGKSTLPTRPTEPRYVDALYSIGEGLVNSFKNLF